MHTCLSWLAILVCIVHLLIFVMSGITSNPLSAGAISQYQVTNIKILEFLFKTKLCNLYTSGQLLNFWWSLSVLSKFIKFGCLKRLLFLVRPFNSEINDTFLHSNIGLLYMTESIITIPTTANGQGWNVLWPGIVHLNYCPLKDFYFCII